ncbi:MAG: type IV pilus assembly protein PilP [Cellvibrionaceae bacterium]|jgi:type IV pilus assembly protein PilP
MKPYFFFVLAFTAIVFISGCNSSESHEDLQDFIAENKRRPPGKIKEAPKIVPYESFIYDAYSLRSPFDRPVSVELKKQMFSSSVNVKPDATRKKERLEQYDLSSLNMVGTLRKDGALWVLISDPDGSIERVRSGNHVGRNNGKIINLTEDKIDLIEIVASGEGWLERPNILQLKTAEEK